MAATSAGQKGPDDYLGVLIHAELPADGALPDSFTGQLRQIGGKRIDDPLTRYVGKEGARQSLPDLVPSEGVTTSDSARGDQ